MKAPRDYQSELDALNAKAKQLKARRVVSLGELVVATGADTLPLDVLAGVLLSAVEEMAQPNNASGVYAERGAAFFQPKPAAAKKAGRGRPSLKTVSPNAA